MKKYKKGLYKSQKMWYIIVECGKPHIWDILGLRGHGRFYCPTSPAVCRGFCKKYFILKGEKPCLTKT
ncbi:MAG: hypothetical protein IKU23_02215 [Clostridia bacterium]|nr:hypothetical protein [Clostridia bacterium]